MPSRRTKPLKRTAATDSNTVIEHDSGNVFAELGLQNPELLLAKATLVRRLRAAMAERGLTDAAAAALLKLDEHKLRALLRGQTGRYSLDPAVPVPEYLRPARRDYRAARGEWQARRCVG